jgi:hypothetical protein
MISQNNHNAKRNHQSFQIFSFFMKPFARRSFTRPCTGNRIGPRSEGRSEDRPSVGFQTLLRPFQDPFERRQWAGAANRQNASIGQNPLFQTIPSTVLKAGFGVFAADRISD